MVNIVMPSYENDDLLVPVMPRKIEEKYNATFVGEFCVKTRDGGWANSPAQVYWQAEPPHGYSNYMAILIQGGQVYITSGAAAASGTLTGIVDESDNNKILYSRYRHDMRMTKDGSAGIDGGRDYTKITGNPRTVTLRFEGPHLVYD